MTGPGTGRIDQAAILVSPAMLSCIAGQFEALRAKLKRS